MDWHLIGKYDNKSAKGLGSNYKRKFRVLPTFSDNRLIRKPTMISPRCFEEAWIREQAAALKARDVRTLEKNILALELVSRLQRLGLDFIFKGGTSLALFFDPVRRLSIDVDVLSLASTERLKAVLDHATTCS